MTTYSFKDLSGAFVHPVAGTYLFSGQQGMGDITVAHATEHTQHDLANDGSVMVSYIPGDNGSVSIQAQQTSPLHAFLLNWINILKTAADNGDLVNWASAALTLRNVLDNSTHIVSGVSPQKVPDKTYSAAGGKVTWNLMAASIISL